MSDEPPAGASAPTTTNDLGELSPELSLAVGNNVTLALRSDALFIKGM